MKLTRKNRKFIDAMDYERLLRKRREGFCNNPWFQGATGRYWIRRMVKLKERNWG